MDYIPNEEFLRHGLWREHKPGDRACSACPGGRALPCICGGVIHSRVVEVTYSADGMERRRAHSRCDRCVLGSGGGNRGADRGPREDPANIV